MNTVDYNIPNVLTILFYRKQLYKILFEKEKGKKRGSILKKKLEEVNHCRNLHIQIFLFINNFILM